MYTPPDYSAVQLRFTQNYTIPSPDKDFILFFGSTEKAETVTKISTIHLKTSKALIVQPEVINTHTTKIAISTTKTIIEPLHHIKSVSTRIPIYSNTNQIELLPQILTQKSKTITITNKNTIAGGKPNDLPSLLGVNSHKLPFTMHGQFIKQKNQLPWGTSKPADGHNKSHWQNTQKLQREVEFPYIQKLPQKNQPNRFKYKRKIKSGDKNVYSAFSPLMPYFDKQNYFSFSSFRHLYDNELRTDFKNFYLWHDLKDQKIKVSFLNSNTKKTKDKHYKEEFNLIQKNKDSHHKTYWGPYWYSLWCTTKYFPWTTDENVHLVLKTDVPITNNPQFITPNNPRCPFDYWYSGDRDNFDPNIDPINTQIVPKRRMYYMLNTAYIKRLPDNTDVPFTSVNLRIDRSSWTWSFNITLATKQSLNLIRPEKDILKDIQININGWKWTCRVESWSENKTFGERSWSVSGRSPSVELSEPYQVDSVFTNSAEQGGQIINSILDNTGWTAQWLYGDFNPYIDWMIPESTINFTNISKIKQIKSIVEEVGAFLQTNADINAEKKLIIIPKYRQTPWNWGSVVPKVVLNESVCHQIDHKSESCRPLNSVIVSGENCGVVVNATRNATAGDKPGAMVFNDFMTTKGAAEERARSIISGSGFWMHHTLNLLFLRSPGAEPGLLLPGDFIEMSEDNNSWKGQVTGTGITAEWSDGLDVSQSIQVEQYYE